MNIQKEFKFLLLLLLTTIVTVYLLPKIISSIWFVIILFLYLRSNDEPLWLAYFLIISVGFVGLFGLYETTLNLIPGLPAIEIAQFYIILSVIKANLKNPTYSVFYKKHLIILGLYVIFLILTGFAIGLSGGINIYLRIFKLTFPLLLFYSIPRLFNKEIMFERLFSFLFPFAIIAFLSQLFHLIIGLSPSEFIGIHNINREFTKTTDEFRVFYSSGIVFITTFASYLYLTSKTTNFKSIYLYIVIILNFLTAFLSATRGWIISFSILFLLYFTIVEKIKVQKIIPLLFLFGAFVLFVSKQPIVKKQFEFSSSRLSTLESIYEGDISAQGTLERLDVRSPRVINKWKEYPIFGTGFSNEWLSYQDGHVGNQNILMHSGIVGAILLFTFFYYFNFKLWTKSKISRLEINKELKIFPVFFISWFFLHSTSGQQFAYYGLPVDVMTKAIFFSLGALLYHKSFNHNLI